MYGRVSTNDLAPMAVYRGLRFGITGNVGADLGPSNSLN